MTESVIKETDTNTKFENYSAQYGLSYGIFEKVLQDQHRIKMAKERLYMRELDLTQRPYPVHIL